MIPHKVFLAALSEARTDEVVVTTMAAAHLWPTLSDHPLDLNYIVSSMGQGPALGLGIALARPGRRVVVVNGDGSTLMNLGVLVTIAEQRPDNLVLFNVENGVYQVTGGQPVAGRGRVSFTGMARAAGWDATFDLNNVDDLNDRLPSLLQRAGPVFVNVRVAPDPEFAVKPKPRMDLAVRALRRALSL